MWKHTGYSQIHLHFIRICLMQYWVFCLVELPWWSLRLICLKCHLGNSAKAISKRVCWHYYFKSLSYGSSLFSLLGCFEQSHSVHQTDFDFMLVCFLFFQGLKHWRRYKICWKIAIPIHLSRKACLLMRAIDSSPWSLLFIHILLGMMMISSPRCVISLVIHFLVGVWYWSMKLVILFIALVFYLKPWL